MDNTLHKQSNTLFNTNYVFGPISGGSPRETAYYIRRSVNNTLQMLHAGIIPAIRVDKRWMVFTDSLDNWLITESERQAKLRQENTN